MSSFPYYHQTNVIPSSVPLSMGIKQKQRIECQRIKLGRLKLNLKFHTCSYTSCFSYIYSHFPFPFLNSFFFFFCLSLSPLGVANSQHSRTMVVLEPGQPSSCTWEMKSFSWSCWGLQLPLYKKKPSFKTTFKKVSFKKLF